jgi:hypothetical protein
MAVKVTVSTEKALRKLKEYERVTGKTIAQSVRNHGRLLGLELMRQAQPFYKKKDDAKAFERGDGAVRKDMNMIFVILNSYWMSRFKDAKEVNESLYNKAGQPWLTDKYRIANTLSEIRAWHKSQRSKTNGRPSKRGDKTIGRHKEHEYMVTTLDLLQRAKDETAKAVGWAKAGWAKAAQECKADTKAAAKLSGIPNWISRHLSGARGTAEDKTNNAKNPHVRLRSGVPYMSRILSQNQINGTLNQSRKNWISMMSRAIKAELKKVKV